MQLPVEQLGDSEYAASRGLALLAFHHLGELSLEEIKACIPVARVYEPRRELAARYDEMFVQFVRAFRRNRSVFRALNVGSDR